MTDEELIARLRNEWTTLDDERAAADRIEALVKERDRQYDENVNRIHQQALAEARADRLDAALQALEKASSEVSRRGAETGPQWSKLTIAILKARAALKGGEA